jgi:putative component of membrane protein insertase Oxa1/YidC/SpoIIIJ protein YidD
VRFRGSRRALLWLACIALASRAWGSEPPRGSASWSGTPHAGEPAEAGSGPAHLWTLPALGAIRLYQLVLSSQDAPSCPFSPSCSHFGQEAIRRFGFQGLLMTSDRLQRCNGSSLDRYVLDPRTGKRLDPVDQDVLWGAGAHWRGPSPGPTFGEEAASIPVAAPASGSAGSAAAAAPVPRLTEAGGPGHPDETRRFADHLYEEGDPLRAAGEYRRFLAQQASERTGSADAVSDSVSLRIGVCLRRGGAPQLAAMQFRSLLGAPTGSFPRCSALTQLARTYWGLHRPRAAVLEIDSLRRSTPAVCRECSWQVLRGASHLLDGSWGLARADLAATVAAGDSGWQQRLPRLRQIAREGSTAPRKSARMAGILSAIVPGAGRAYVGRRTDGVFSLASILLLGWQAASGFHQDGRHSARGIIYGSLFLGTYAGNVYGSALSARIHDRRLDERLIRDAREALEVSDP